MPVNPSKNAEYMRAYRKMKRKRGECCFCKAPLSSQSTWMCARHLKAMSVRNAVPKAKRLRKKRPPLRPGYCTICHLYPLAQTSSGKSKTRCRRCLNAQSAYARKTASEKKEVAIFEREG